LLVLGAIALAAVSMSIVPALSGTITTLDGGAVSEAYIAYRHKGSRFNFVDTLSYYRPGEVLQTDATASVDVPGFLQVHYPWDGRPRIEFFGRDRRRVLWNHRLLVP
jgi:hypothetical protein